MSHLMEVTGWDAETARAHIDQAFDAWRDRNEIDWTLDLSVLIDYGVTVGQLVFHCLHRRPMIG